MSFRDEISDKTLITKFRFFVNNNNNNNNSNNNNNNNNNNVETLSLFLSVHRLIHKHITAANYTDDATRYSRATVCTLRDMKSSLYKISNSPM